MKRSSKWSKVLETVLIYAFLFVFGFLVVVGVWLSSTEDICDSIFGANDLRCVGHFR